MLGLKQTWYLMLATQLLHLSAYTSLQASYTKNTQEKIERLIEVHKDKTSKELKSIVLKQNVSRKGLIDE